MKEAALDVRLKTSLLLAQDCYDNADTALPDSDTMLGNFYEESQFFVLDISDNS